MTTFAEPTAFDYQPHLTSTVEQGSLHTELVGRTSRSETIKSSVSPEWHISAFVPPFDESFLAFCADIFHVTDDIHEDDEPLSKGALWAALQTVGDAVAQLPNQWRRPRITTDGAGGIRLTWRSGGKEMRAVFPANPARQRYLYVEEGEQNKLIPNFNGMTLCNEWLHSTK